MEARKIIKSHRLSVILAHVGAIAAVSIMLCILAYFDILVCPMQVLFDIPCPFCGMTRAHLAALRLDFSLAFAYNPAFFLGIPFLWLLFHDKIFSKNQYLKLLRYILLAICISVLMTAYLFTLFN